MSKEEASRFYRKRIKKNCSLKLTIHLYMMYSC